MRVAQNKCHVVWWWYEMKAENNRDHGYYQIEIFLGAHKVGATNMYRMLI